MEFHSDLLSKKLQGGNYSVFSGPRVLVDHVNTFFDAFLALNYCV